MDPQAAAQRQADAVRAAVARCTAQDLRPPESWPGANGRKSVAPDVPSWPGQRPRRPKGAQPGGSWPGAAAPASSSPRVTPASATGLSGTTSTTPKAAGAPGQDARRARTVGSALAFFGWLLLLAGVCAWVALDGGHRPVQLVSFVVVVALAAAHIVLLARSGRLRPTSGTTSATSSARRE